MSEDPHQREQKFNKLSFQALVGMYVLTLVFMVRRQLRMVVKREMVKVLITDERGETIIKDMDDTESNLL